MRNTVRVLLVGLFTSAAGPAWAEGPFKPAPPPKGSPVSTKVAPAKPAPTKPAEPPPPPAIKYPPSTIEMFIRAPGSPSPRGQVTKQAARVVDLDGVPLEDVRQNDVQYGAVRSFRGIRLNLLISRYAPPLTTDLAILHFANGMAVPVPFRDEHVMSKMNPLVARGVRPEDAGANAPATPEFPPAMRKVEGLPAPLPLPFKGNKLVVADRAHPQVPTFQQEAFSPWLLVDSLEAIEFVNSGSYWRQFDVNPTSRDTREGLAVFTRACNFCHGVRQMGAHLGRDFIEPAPIIDVKKTPIKLFIHMRAAAGPSKNPLMPQLSQMDQDDARLLHMWLRALTEKPLVPYTIDPPPAPKAPPKDAATPPPAPTKNGRRF